MGFCSTIDRGKTRDTVRLSVYEMMPERMIGPLEAYQIDKLVGNETRCILELQECCSPVPTTADESPEVRKHSSSDTDTWFSGRLISPKANLNLFSRWIKLCGILHGERCGRPILPVQATRGLKSLLVIDVEQMCIINAPAQCRYVALSYCWGRAPVLKHTLGNSTPLQKSGGLLDSGMPATITDAIELVRGVREKYLWVDALCIIQDDPTSQRAQLAQMGLIYSLAAFTIVAASGDNANAGLPGVRADRNIDQKLVRVGERVLLAAVDGHDYYGGIKKWSWATRAWTMQEKILSKKVLIFTDQQVYWRCWSSVWMEEIVLEDVFNITFQHDPADMDKGSGFHSHKERRDNHHLYYSLVNAYRERRLTFKSDILNAFLGLCQALSAIEGESFHWGLPVSIFQQSLCWYLRGGGTRNQALCDPDGVDPSALSVSFPNWSWTAWHGTSGSSWIHFEAVGKRKKAAEGENVIRVFAYDQEGRLKELGSQSSLIPADGAERHAPTDYQRQESKNITRPWKGQPQIIQDEICPAPINTGLLHFWISTAILSIRRRPNPHGTPTMVESIMEFRERLLVIDEWDYLQSLDE